MNEPQPKIGIIARALGRGVDPTNRNIAARLRRVYEDVEAIERDTIEAAPSVGLELLHLQAAKRYLLQVMARHCPADLVARLNRQSAESLVALDPLAARRHVRPVPAPLFTLKG